MSSDEVGGNQVAVPEVVLSTPFFPGPEDVEQGGSEVELPVRVCDGLGVVVSLVPAGADVDAPRADVPVGVVPSSFQVQEQRLQVGAGSVYVSDPYRLPCEDGGACAGWQGWYFTMESAGQGDAVFQVPVQWSAVSTSSLDAQGQLEVHVEVDAAS